MDELKHKQRTIAQIMADADLLDRARIEHEQNALPSAGRRERLFYFRNLLEPRAQDT